MIPHFSVKCNYKAFKIRLQSVYKNYRANKNNLSKMVLVPLDYRAQKCYNKSVVIS